MVKKGKAPAKAPAAGPASSKAAPAKASSSKTTSSKAASSKSSSKKAAPPEDDLLIFTTDKERKKRDTAAAEAGPPEPPKPTAKQIIGGQSWTGKLPVNLLSEHCQKMKWQRPDYIQRTSKEGISFMVVISTKDPKTQEVKKLEPFKLPPSLVDMAYKETALEAKHFAATYGLFRVASGKNLSMILPPDYRSVWKEFDNLKKQDIKEGKAWMYDANPFKALEEREAAKAAAEKKRKEQEAAREKAANLPGAEGLVLRGNAAAAGGGGYNPMKGWTTVPKIEMGNKTRQHLESLLRRDTIWNPHGVVMQPAAKAAITKEFTGLGFRASHIEEAVEECKDREETLEWLLIHVPEDDLPKWALPGSYSAGVSVAATNLRREGATQRLALSGYSIELCRKVYDESDSDEGKAAETLQRILLASGSDVEADSTFGQDALSNEERDQQWEEELASLEALFGEQYSRLAPDICQLKLLDVTNGAKKNVDASIQFRKSPHYPSQLILQVVADLPSYIKLSIIKKTLAYIADSLQGEEMKMFYVISWVQESINDIIERPGALREIAAVSSTVAEEKGLSTRKKSKRPSRQPKPISWVPESGSIGRWMERQKAHSFQKMVEQRKKLPAWQVKEDVVDTVNDNQITIISGETGSGKSTQSVQFILDDLYDRGYAKCANIIVTQPRRISALGLADRVSEERDMRVGQEVGYSIRGENKTSNETKITFVTTGVLLRRLQTSGGKIEDVVSSLADISHVVIDEVHERSLDTDFLLSIIRDVLSKRKDLKLILMSATLDSATFGDYFKKDGLKVGFVEIAGRTFPVQDFYLDDIIHQTGFIGNDYDGKASDRTLDDNQRVSKVIQNLGMRINYNLLAETAKAIDSELAQTQKSGGILIFLPGVNEINQTCRYLSSISNLHVLPLHASLETKEQKKVFAPPPHGKRKVVVATNVAETSITIDDIVAVIDSGRVKETSYDPQTNMRKLEETWASRAACKQRRGRAGRVQEGKCYKLYTRNLEEQTMAERPDPEIRRVPLEQLCLSVRAMGNKDVGHFLSRTPTPPEAVAVEGAVKMLRRMGALDGDELTALGQQLAMIPADLRCGKLMVYGAIFNCLDDCVTIAAILSTRSPFLSPPDKRDLAKQAKMRFAAGDGDLLTDLRAFQQWDEQMQDRLPQRQVRTFCDDNFLSYNTLSDIASTRTQYYSALSEIGLIDLSLLYGRSQQKSTASTSLPLLRALTASAFSPQIARIQFPDKKFMASVSGAVELDPEAKTIRYYTQENGRVFVHPSSTLFESQGFSGNAAFVSYFTLMATSKVFVRDLTPFNAYTLLLFSGAIELDTLGRGLVVDGWLRLRGWARIGVLISRLRGMVDDIIAKKVENPSMDLRNDDVIRAVVKLIELDGLDAKYRDSLPDSRRHGASIRPRAQSPEKFRPEVTVAPKRKRGDVDDDDAENHLPGGQGDGEEDEAMSDGNNDEDDEDDDSPDEEEARAARRQKKRNGASRVRKAPAAKKPKTNGTAPAQSMSIPSRPKAAKKTARVVTGDRRDGDGVYADIFGSGDNSDDVASRWYQKYRADNEAAVTDLVNCVLLAAGCDEQVTEDDIRDPDNIQNRLSELQDLYQERQVTDYPLGKIKESRGFRDLLVGFFESLVNVLHETDALYTDEPLMENIARWVYTMSSSTLRPFRHTATTVALAMELALASVARKLDDRATKTSQQIDAEKARKGKSRNKDMLANLQKSLNEANNNREMCGKYMLDCFEVVFVHRYRDIDARIRTECVEALGSWIWVLPTVFMEPEYLRYLGWLLSDVNAPTRQEVLKQLARVFKRDAAKLGHFIDRFRPRLMEMATQDLDVSVRVQAINVIEALSENGMLEPDEIDNVGKLIFDSEPRIRKSVVKFFADVVQGAVEQKVESMGGEEAVDEMFPESEDVDDFTPRKEWVEIKALAENLAAYEQQLEEDDETEGRRVLDMSADMTSIIAPETRMSLAAQVLYEKMETVKDWGVLIGYLLYDHTTSTKSGARSKNSTASQMRQHVAPTGEEETILLQVLVAAVKSNLLHIAEADKGRKKPIRGDVTESAEDVALTLAQSIPKLLSKFGADAKTATTVMRLQSLLDLDVFQQLRQESSTLEHLLDGICTLFTRHSDPNVVLDASIALLRARNCDEFQETTDLKISELWEPLIDTVRNLDKSNNLSRRGELSGPVLTRLSELLMKMSNLARINDCVDVLEAESTVKGSTASVIDILVQTVHRGRFQQPDEELDDLEDETTSFAIKCCDRYFMWKVLSLVRAIEMQTDVSSRTIGQLASLRKLYQTNLIHTLSSRAINDDLRLFATRSLCDLHTHFALIKGTLDRWSSVGAAKKYAGLLSLNQEIQPGLVPELINIFDGAERAYAKKAKKHLNEPAEDEDPIDDDQLSEVDEDEDLSPSEKRASELRAEKALCELTSAYVRALLRRVVDQTGPNAGKLRKRLHRNVTKLGRNYQETLAFLDVEKMREQAAAKARRAASRAKAKAPAANSGTAAVAATKEPPKSAEIVVAMDDESDEEEAVPDEDTEEDLRRRELLEDPIEDPESDPEAANHVADEESILGD